MRVANVSGRLHVQIGDGVVDVAKASGGEFDSDPQAAYGRWDELRSWADGVDPGRAVPTDLEQFGAPAPRPHQVFAIALNYRAHAIEAGHRIPTFPGVFTKFPTCLTGPRATIHLPTDAVDWEVELVVVIGKRGEHVAESDAWKHVAGLTVGQDISERNLQLSKGFPQLSLAKSMPGFGPCGPAVVSLDEVVAPDDLAVECRVNDVVRQQARTSDLVFSVSELISRISAICPMMPGDLIFTGTPGGVGAGQVPPVYLRDGDVIVTTIDGLGELRNRCTTDGASTSFIPRP